MPSSHSTSSSVSAASTSSSSSTSTLTARPRALSGAYVGPDKKRLPSPPADDVEVDASGNGTDRAPRRSRPSRELSASPLAISASSPGAPRRHPHSSAPPLNRTMSDRRSGHGYKPVEGLPSPSPPDLRAPATSLPLNAAFSTSGKVETLGSVGPTATTVLGVSMGRTASQREGGRGTASVGGASSHEGPTLNGPTADPPKTLQKKRSRGALLGQQVRDSAVLGSGIPHGREQQSPRGEAPAENGNRPNLVRQASSSLRHGPPQASVSSGPLPTPPITDHPYGPASQVQAPSLTSSAYGYTSSAATTPGATPATTPLSPPQAQSSRTVLTIALQKAQAAVLLDTAEDVPGAIAAYTEAVSLLEDVMARMEATNQERAAKEAEQEEKEKAWEAAQVAQIRVSRGGVGNFLPSEAEIKLRDREAKRADRKARAHKKAQARAEEAARLAKIVSCLRPGHEGCASNSRVRRQHDTYASRISELETELAAAGMQRRPSTASVDQGYSSGEAQPYADASTETPTASPPMVTGPATASARNSLPTDKPFLIMADSPPAQQVSFGPLRSAEAGTESPHEPRRKSRPTSASFPTLPVDGRRPSLGDELATSAAPLDKRSSMASDRTARPASVAADAARSLAPVDEVGVRSTEAPRAQRRATSKSRAVDVDFTSEDDVTTDEEKDVVESLPSTGGSTGYSESSRDRSSSSVSAASSLWDRMRSRESLATSTRTSTSSLPGPSQKAISPPADGSLFAARSDERSPTSAGVGRKGSLSPPSSANAPLSSLPPDSADRQSLLVNSNTREGTISRRRRSPLAGAFDSATASDARQSMEAEASTSRRTSGASSLPQRLRALSQPGKRPSQANFNGMFTKDLQQRAAAESSAMARKNSASSTNQAGYPSFQTQLEPPSRDPSPALSANGLGSPTPTSSAVQRPAATPVAPTDIQPYPANPARRPFHLMRQLRTTIMSGGYLTARLYVPQATWSTANMSLVALKAVETKVKLIECLIGGLDGVEKDGDALLPPRVNAPGHPPPSNQSTLLFGERFIRRLETFEELMENLRSTFGKKIATGAEFGSSGRKSGGFGGLSQKLGRSFDRMTSSKK